MKMMERKANLAFGETGFGEMGFGKTGFGETGRHYFTPIKKPTSKGMWVS